MWFITVFEKCELDKLGWLDTGCDRTWGYYSERETAVQALHENWTDMWETCYQYAVLEKFDEGVSGYVWGSRQFFKFDEERRGYFEIEEPECTRRFVSFALG